MTIVFRRERMRSKKIKINSLIFVYSFLILW